MTAPVSTAPASTTTPDAPVSRRPARRLVRTRRISTGRRIRRGARNVVVVTHRWVSLVLGLVLIAITTSGAIVLYEGDWQTWAHPDVYHHGASASLRTPLSFDQSLAVVRQAHPDFEPGTVNVFAGAHEVMSTDSEAHPGRWVVDPQSGRITGHVTDDHGFMAFMVNLHECALSCEGYTGYVSFLAKTIPGLPAPMDELTWAGGVLALMGLLLLFLALSGLVLWWPGIKRWSHGFRVRWRQSRYTRDFDLHQLAGLVVVPFLLMWGLTGTSFELPIDNAWYAVTGGAAQEDKPDFVSHEAPAGAPDLTADQAVAAATSVSPGIPAYVALPSEEGTKGAFDVWLSAGTDPYRYGHGPGQVLIKVDRHDPGHTREDYSAAAATLSNQVWDVWRSGMLHYGFAVNPWWRLVWFLFGIAPLLLAVTGLSTWLYKRGVEKRRRQARAARAADPRLTDEAAGAALADAVR